MMLSELIEKVNKALSESGDLPVYIEMDIVGFETTQAISRPAKSCWSTQRYNSANNKMDDIFEIVAE
jgi:hypothetical protein